MIGKLLGKEEVNAALVLALSGVVMVLVARGDGPLSVVRIREYLAESEGDRRIEATAVA
jgi:hypothetical protein